MMARADDQTLLIAFIFFVNLFLTLAMTDPLDLSALQALYGSLNSPPQLTGWRSTGGDPCGDEPWRGVSCSGQSVISIKIKGLGVGGFLGSQLSTLLSFEELDVSYNNIGGEIPSGLPPNAAHINLAVNNFTWSLPYSLPSLKALKHLNISHNSLSGPLGNVFTDMKSLEQLDLSFNNFTGDLPSSFGSLTNLHALYLQNNQFTGSVIFLANLPLSVLDIENNHFSGYVPKRFESIPRLRINGNLFQPGFTLPLPFMNESTHPPLSSADKNISHGPKVTPSSFGFSSVQVGRNNQKRRLRLGAVAGTICGVFLAAIFAVTVIIIRFHRSSKSNHDRSTCSDESLPALPITAPTEPAMNLNQCTWESPPMTSIRPPSVRHLKPGRISKKKSCSRKSKNLVNAKLFSASDLLEATNNYSEENVLGEGSIGRVYKAEFPDGQILVVKKIDMVALAVYEEDEFLDVIWNMSRLRHPNIITLLGYCVEQGQHILVYDYARNGSLDDVISSVNDTRKALSWKARVRIALGVAHALEYMHLICFPPMGHGNIKASNILLDNELTPHISDCGLTVLRHLVSSMPTASELPTGSNGYAAPELSIPGADKTKSDVYSFGIVLLELLTGRRAFDSSRRKEEQSLVKWASSRLHDFSSLEGMVDPAIKGTIPSKALSRFADIIMLCIQPEPEFRSGMNDIAESLISLVLEMAHHPRTNNKLSSTEVSELNVSELSFKSTLAYFESSSSPLST